MKAVLSAYLILISGFAVAGSADVAPLSAEATGSILKNDQLLFEIVFDTCDVDALGEMLADDFEFYHDKWGQTADSKEEFLGSIRNQCDERAAGTSIHARRELVESHTEFFPMRGYGAIQMGVHKFYGVNPEGPDTLRETAKFTHLWEQKEDGSWRLTRVLSYDHRDAMPEEDVQVEEKD